MVQRQDKHRTLAERADRHRLYELSVQCAESEVDFVDATYHTLRGRYARSLREDFCGTANVCCEWVKHRISNQAIGVDIDAKVLSWGKEHNLPRLDASEAQRIRLLQANVLNVRTPPPDIISAMNFSYWLLKERSQLKQYFRQAREVLADDGVLFLDAYGGYDSYRVTEESREVEGYNGSFTYIWDQEKYDPISGGLICHIHFSFPDGSRLDRAFSYDWRLWTLPEIRELLSDVGFHRILVYWQGWDEDGNPDGCFQPVPEGEPDAGWICYISAEK